MGNSQTPNSKSQIPNSKSEIRNPKSQPACPFCGSTDSELMSLFGQQLMGSQYYCRNCRTAFESVRWVEE